MMKKKIILPTVFALSILVIGILSSNNVSAQQTYPSIVTRIAQKFNLKVSDVEVVFDEERDARRAEMFARFSENLDELVTSGKITSEQKEAILDKHEEMQNKMEDLSGATFEERHEKMREVHEEFRNWLIEQGLEDLEIGPLGRGFRKGFGMGYKMGGSQ